MAFNDSIPITQSLSFLTLILSFFYGGGQFVSFDLEAILLHGQIYRILLSHIIFSSMSQTILGLVLLYTCRHFERQLGIRKFGAFVFMGFVSSVLLQLALSATAMSFGPSKEFVPSSGPYFLIFSLLPMFRAYIPKFHASSYTLFGVGFSEKTWTYLLALQLLCCQGLSSISAGLIGLLIGYMYVNNIFRFQAVRLPRAVEYVFSLFGRFITSLLPTDTAPRRVPPNPMMPGAAGGVQMRPTAPMGPMAGFQQPSEADIATLTSMGFDRAAVIHALQVTGSVDAAANMLLR